MVCRQESRTLFFFFLSPSGAGKVKVTQLTVREG